MSEVEQDHGRPNRPPPESAAAPPASAAPAAHEARAARTTPLAPVDPATVEAGQGLVEYALIIFLVAIVVIAILLLLGPQIGVVFSSIYAQI